MPKAEKPPQDSTPRALTPKQVAYLKALSVHGQKTKAAQEANVDRSTAYLWLKSGSDEYRQAHEEAIQLAVEGLESYAFELATRKKKPDRGLLMRLLEAHDPKYRQRREVAHSGEVTVKRVVLEGGLPEHLSTPDTEESES